MGRTEKLIRQGVLLEVRPRCHGTIEERSISQFGDDKAGEE